MALSQMNVRIDEQVRIQGNQALESVGLTPARTVRDLWGFASRNRNNPVRLKRVLRFLEEAERDAEAPQSRLQAVENGWSMADEGLAALGISVADVEPIPLDELKEQAYRERWEAKGLL